MSQAELTADVLSEFLNLAVKWAPELSQSPVYLTTLPARYPPVGDTLAFTITRGIDFAIRRHLVEQGRWNGPGTLIAFCAPMSHDESLGLLVHELAHALPFAMPSADTEPTAELLAAQQKIVARKLAQPIGDLPTMPAWYSNHGLQFVRRCLHLHHRAWQSGVEIGLPMIAFAGPDYDLSPPWRYRRALGHEPQRMALATFAEIDATPMPKEFRQLFHSDFQQWCESTGKAPSHVHAA